MSTKHTVPGPNGQPVKTPGWFSWRHETNAEHTAAREKYLASHGPAARRAKAAARLAAKES